MQRWPQNFAYRIDIGAFAFVAGAVLTLVVAALTVGLVSARAAGEKPIHSLRYE